MPSTAPSSDSYSISTVVFNGSFQPRCNGAANAKNGIEDGSAGLSDLYDAIVVVLAKGVEKVTLSASMRMSSSISREPFVIRISSALLLWAIRITTKAGIMSFLNILDLPLASEVVFIERSL
jgi:hypothetical protein